MTIERHVSRMSGTSGTRRSRRWPAASVVGYEGRWRPGNLRRMAMAILCLAGLTTGPASPPRAARAKDSTASIASFAGTWNLNRALSDDVWAYFQEELNRRPRHHRELPDDLGRPRGVGGASSTSGGLPVGATRRVERRNPEEIRARLELLADGFESLSIRHEAPILSIHQADGRVRSLRTDGKKQREQTVNGRVVVSTRWKKDGRLIVTTGTDWGRETTETFTILPDTGQLRVTLDVYAVGGLPEVHVQRTYDRAGQAVRAPADPAHRR
ncbi:MAG: hypothetical protein ACE5IK_03355 [Acidobacteriota bacterium]